MSIAVQPTRAQQTRHSLGYQTVKARPLIPEFEKFLHTENQVGEPGHKLLISPLSRGTDTETSANKRLRKTFKYGVQWKPESFLEQAKQAAHPRNPQLMLPDYLKEAMFQVLTHDSVQVSKHRLQVILAIRAKSKELQDEERKLKQSLDSEANAVLAPKHITLSRYLLETTGFDDMAVVDMVAKGIALHGSHSVPPQLPS